MVPASVRGRLSSTREGEILWRVCLQPHLEQGRMPPAEGSKGAGHCFFLFNRWELLKVPDSQPWILS